MIRRPRIKVLVPTSSYASGNSLFGSTSLSPFISSFGFFLWPLYFIFMASFYGLCFSSLWLLFMAFIFHLYTASGCAPSFSIRDASQCCLSLPLNILHRVCLFIPLSHLYFLLLLIRSLHCRLPLLSPCRFSILDPRPRTSSSNLVLEHRPRTSNLVLEHRPRTSNLVLEPRPRTSYLVLEPRTSNLFLELRTTLDC